LQGLCNMAGWIYTSSRFAELQADARIIENGATISAVVGYTYRGNISKVIMSCFAVSQHRHPSNRLLQGCITWQGYARLIRLRFTA
jgi:hypothetical protein